MMPRSSPVGAFDLRTVENSSSRSSLLAISTLGACVVPVWTTCWKSNGPEMRCFLKACSSSTALRGVARIDSLELSESSDEALDLPFFDLFEPRENNAFPKNCIVSGRSALIDIPVVDFRDVCLESASSGDLVPESATEADDDVELVPVLVLEWPAATLLFICSVYALILCGDGGPSMAGSMVKVGDTRAGKSVVNDAAVDPAGLLVGFLVSTKWKEAIYRDIFVDFCLAVGGIPSQGRG
jgi:hypothetical protein